nr:unnamed protein product [Callosobruchus analis]
MLCFRSVFCSLSLMEDLDTTCNLCTIYKNQEQAEFERRRMIAPRACQDRICSGQDGEMSTSSPTGGQSDIKKLKRENEMLKKGLWYLRDEYDKLERLIKDKKIDFSSSSTTCTSSSESVSVFPHDCYTG